MTISGFTMVRNADKYYFPIKEAIMSVLPIVDEFIVALGDCDERDRTRALLESIGSPKVKIFDRIWSQELFLDGKIFAEETTFALSQCSGDWCFYLQADEVIHEDDLPIIVKECQTHLHNLCIDGFLFNYLHFWGDYAHYLPVHGWYKHDIRIVRNRANIYSYKDAQSFRKNQDQKLNVVAITARVFHYGWVRPPRLMQSKKKEQDSMHHGVAQTTEAYRQKAAQFDYGALGNIPVYEGSHPGVMHTFMQKIDWLSNLNYGKKAILHRPLMKHERLKYRILTRLENILNGGRDFWGYSNWNKIR